MGSEQLEEERSVGRKKMAGDPHDPEIYGVRIICLTEILLELGGGEPDVVIVVGCHPDIRYELQCLGILRHNLRLRTAR